MNAQSRPSIGKALAIFIGLAAVFVALIVAATLVSGSFAQLVLVAVGSAMLGSGLTFFLVRAAQ